MLELVEQFVQRLNRAFFFNIKFFCIDLFQILDLVEHISNNLDTLRKIVLLRCNHHARNRVDSQNIRPPFFEIETIFLRGSVLIDKTEQLHIALCIANNAVIVSYLEQKNIALVEQAAFIKQFTTVRFF